MEASPQAVRLRHVSFAKFGGDVVLGPSQRLGLPAGRVRDAELSPDGRSVAVLVWTDAEAGARGRTGSLVLVAPTRGGTPATVFGAPGRLSQLAWSPSGEQLLIS